MSPFPFSIVGDGESRYITAFIGGKVFSAHESHPSFDEIVEAVRDPWYSANDLADLFDVAPTIARRLTPLSERVSVVGGSVLFDGNPQDGTIVDQIVRFLDEDRDDWKPLVAFMENVAANPNDHSREQLYDWLRVNDLTITDDGLIVGYKGVGPGPNYLSGHSGYGVSIVNGVATKFDHAKIPNYIGSTVEMPRDRVQHDPSNSCSTGLHVGTKDYANGFNSGGLLEVHVNPRDVVSVPTDANGEKVRVSRYKVVAAVSHYADRYGRY